MSTVIIIYSCVSTQHFPLILLIFLIIPIVDMHMMVQNPEGITVNIFMIIVENNFYVHDAFFTKLG
jgi:hypothetical protein